MKFAKKSGSLYAIKQRLNNVEDAFINSIYSKVAGLLQFVLNGRANELGKESGFIIRQRKLTGSNFIKILVFGWLQKTDPSVEALARAGFSHDLTISAQGLDKRFTEKAAAFVKRVLEEALGQVVKAKTAVDVNILNRFSHVYVADCSVITLPDELHPLWPGTGGAAGRVKGGQMIREQSARLAVCLNEVKALARLLRELAQRFKIGCRQNKRLTHPNTWRQLLEGYEFS